MHHHYTDIRERILDKPLWFDEHAVPRYCEFTPDATSDIYASEAVLLHIECQGCGVAFKVCMSLSHWERVTADRFLSDEIRNQQIHYGDPPNVGCCGAGATMNSVPRRVLEYWRREKMDWIRDETLEIAIEPDWWTP